MRIFKTVAIFTLICMGLNSCEEKTFIEYRPHYLNASNDKKSYGEPELDSVEFSNTLQVLEFYTKEFKTKNGNVILIKKKLANDWELLWNYTTKANDSDWLKTHKVQ